MARALPESMGDANTVKGRRAKTLTSKLEHKVAEIAAFRPKHLKPLTVVDLFCGAGGASQGLLRALAFANLTPESLAEFGYYLRLININHWEIAIDTIKRNIAFAEMYNASIENWDPSGILDGTEAHLLIGAPECIAHSYAKGGAKIKDQSRTTAAWVTDWVKTRPHAIYLENVGPWKSWGPLDDAGNVIKERRGEYFDGFIQEIKELGYHRLRYDTFVCANYGDATTRERLFVTALRDDYADYSPFPNPTHTEFPERYPHLQAWVPARDCIDLTRESNYLTERDTIHAPTTIRRIRAGFANQNTFDSPLLTAICDRLEPIATAAHEILNARPSGAKRKLTKDDKKNNKAILERVRAEAASAIELAASESLGYFDPATLSSDVLSALGVIIGQHSGSAPRTVDDPLMAIQTDGAIGLAQPTICKANASEKSAFNDATQDIDHPFNTIVTKDCRALAEPSLVVVRHGNDDIRTPSLDKPVGAITAKNELGLSQPTLALAESTIINLYSSNVEGGKANASAAIPTSKPMPTIVAGGNHHGLAQQEIILAKPIVPRVYGEKHEGENRSSTIDDPLGAITAGGNHHSVAEPVIISRNNAEEGDRRARSLDEPIGTSTARGAGYLAEPRLIPQHFDAEPQSLDRPTPTIVAIARIGLAEATLISRHGTTGEDDRAPHSLDEPVRTITTYGVAALAQPTVTSNHFDNAGSAIDAPLGAATTATGGGMGVSQPFLTPNFGEREKQAPRHHSIDEPLPAVTSHGAGMLVDMQIKTEHTPPPLMFHFFIGEHKIYINIRYRMLHSTELAKAHNLGHVDFGPHGEAAAIRMIGNSIPAKTAAAFIAHIISPVLQRIDLPRLKAA